MIKIRKSEERGHANHGWLNSYHTFSFAGFHDPKHMGYRSLRVINEDRVAPGRGFGAHAHQDMEILSYVLKGSLAHKDNMGHQETLGPNEIQRMSAGTGIMHSEFNGSQTDPVHFFQIWIQPATAGSPPTYEQLKFEPGEKRSRWKLLAGPVAEPGVSRINQDVKVMISELSSGEQLSYELTEGRYGWLHVVSGGLTLNGEALHSGDAAAIENISALDLKAQSDTEILFFDLA